ncbi:expressed protein [Chlorella variabilis]|uniref:Expressed protein n=1 Tax=Chlorella variabilis TaxID=554065 RepID=E1ZC60_CHLVA|nr:expressed protein [Chlorella variabilis]EFN56554.1 expressed protein [Chlorella variabilis]|eukprot:XP_005848656.1 expressed protein [Chlorella variabilis]
MKLAGVSAAAWHAARLLAFLAFAAAAGTLLLRVLDRAAGRHIRAADGAGRFNVGAEALAAAFTPCQLMLPIYCATRAGTVVLALAVVAATKCGVDPAALLICRMDQQLLAALRWLSLAAGGEAKQVQVMAALQWATQLVQDCSELVVIVGLAWAAIDFKSRLIEWAAERLQTDDDVHNDGMAPLLRLGNTGVTIAIVLLAAAVALAGFGFHIGPLLASVGGVGVVIGLATQQLLSNIVAAISLYSTRPFVTGDVVELVNPEGVEVAGTVLNIEPTRTILLDESSGCIVHVSNSDIGDYIIKNASQYRALTRLQGQQAAGGADGSPTRTMQELVRAMRSTSSLSYDGEEAQERGGGGGAPAGQAV